MRGVVEDATIVILTSISISIRDLGVPLSGILAKIGIEVSAWNPRIT